MNKQCDACSEICGKEAPCACEPGAGPRAKTCVYCGTDIGPLYRTAEGAMCPFCYYHGDEAALYAALNS